MSDPTESSETGEERHCSVVSCWKLYRVPSELGICYRDLESIELIRNGFAVAATDVGLCPDCIIRLLAGKPPFKRSGKTVRWNG